MPKNRKLHPWNRRQRNLLYAAGALFLLILVLGIFRYIHGGEVDRQIAELREKGMPTNLVEREQWLPVVPDEENAAKLYLEAFAIQDPASQVPRKFLNDFYNAFLDAPLCQPIDEVTSAELEAYLTENEQKLELLHQARNKSHARYPSPKLDFAVQENYPHHDKVELATHLLIIEAWWAIGQQDSALATDAFLTAIATVESLRDEPALSSQWYRLYSHGSLTYALAKMLCINPFTDTQLLLLSHAFSSAENPEAWTNALIGTRAIALQAYESPPLLNEYVSQDRFLKWVPASVSTLKMGADLIGWIDADRLHFLNLMQDLIDASRLPYSQSIDAAAVVRERTLAMSKLWRAAPEAILFFLNTVNEAAQDSATLRNITTALAIERFRLAFGKIPEQLDDLVPTYLDTLPMDPYTDKPIQYKVLDEGYIVYSVYVNIDEDGTRGSPFARNPRNGNLLLKVAH